MKGARVKERPELASRNVDDSGGNWIRCRFNPMRTPVIDIRMGLARLRKYSLDGIIFPMRRMGAILGVNPATGPAGKVGLICRLGFWTRRVMSAGGPVSPPPQADALAMTNRLRATWPSNLALARRDAG